MKKQFVFSPGLEPGLDVYKTSSLTISRREGENSVFHNRLFLTNTMKKHKSSDKWTRWDSNPY